MNRTEKLAEGIYTFPVRLPHSPLKELNVYVIKGRKKSLVIDLGFNLEECYQDVTEGLAEIGVDKEDVDIFFTHQHIDHTGLLDRMLFPRTEVYITSFDAEWVNLNSSYKGMAQRLRLVLKRAGFDLAEYTEEELDQVYADMPNALGLGAYTPVKEGMVLAYGDYQLHCLRVPGHTRGHAALYEPGHKMIFAGDHILDSITPNIAVTPQEFSFDTLGAYIQSLHKVEQMDIELVCPAHGNRYSDHRRRIGELLEHHAERNREILALLQNSGVAEMTATEIAAGVTWHLKNSDWKQAPLRQKQFMIMETMAHMTYLANLGTVELAMKGEVALYRLAGGTADV